MNYRYEYFDHNYSCAVNYTGRNYYHSPITITVAGVKYITGFGTKDKKYHKVDGKNLHIVAINSGLDYASLMSIDTNTQTVSDSFVNSLEQEFYDMCIDAQIAYLQQYAPC